MHSSHIQLYSSQFQYHYQIIEFLHAIVRFFQIFHLAQEFTCLKLFGDFKNTNEIIKMFGVNFIGTSPFDMKISIPSQNSNLYGSFCVENC